MNDVLERVDRLLGMNPAPPAATPILVMDDLVGLDRDLEEFEVRLLARHGELVAAADKLKALIDTIRRARAQQEGKP